jgi:hypothetical protein
MLKKNFYSQKQAGRVWNKHLVSKLKAIGFVRSKVDECVFYKDGYIYVFYTDDSILTGPKQEELDQIIQAMKDIGLDLTEEGDMADLLGVKIERMDNGHINLTQLHLIDQILKDLRLGQDSKNTTAAKLTPMACSRILLKHQDSEPFDGHFDYRSVIGKLLYLEKSTRPNIAYADHQCACFASDPKVEHGKAVKWLGRYLFATRDKGMILNPRKKQSFDCFMDADFCGNWNRDEAGDPSTARSRTSDVIKYANCPISWASKMQMEVSLSTTESEYVALSTALRECIPILQLISELRMKYHHFRDHVVK